MSVPGTILCARGVLARVAAANPDDTPAAQKLRFLTVLKGLVVFVGSVNEFIQDEYEITEIPEFMMSLANMALGALDPSSKIFEAIVTQFTRRAAASIDAIIAGDREHFAKEGPKLAPEISSSIIATLTQVVVSERLGDEAAASFFDNVKALIRIGVKFHAAGRFDHTEPPSDEETIALAGAAVKLDM
jgi:hypothetical protein